MFAKLLVTNGAFISELLMSICSFCHMSRDTRQSSIVKRMQAAGHNFILTVWLCLLRQVSKDIWTFLEIWELPLLPKCCVRPAGLCVKLQLADSLSFTAKGETLVLTLEVVAMVCYPERASNWLLF